MYDDNMLYGFTQSLNKLAIAVCFTRQAFLYKLEYDSFNLANWHFDLAPMVWL